VRLVCFVFYVNVWLGTFWNGVKNYAFEITTRRVYIPSPMSPAKDMYRSKRQISRENLPKLKANLVLFLRQKNRVYCRALKRPVHLTKLPDALVERQDAKRRLQRFLVAVDILAGAKTYERRQLRGKTNYEITGMDVNGVLVCVHVREEVVRKDRILYFVSCY